MSQAPPRRLPTARSRQRRRTSILERRSPAVRCLPHRGPPSTASERSWRKRSANRRGRETRCHRSERALASSRTSSAIADNGTTCSTPDFIRSPAASSIGPPRSISRHCAPSASAGRAARHDHEHPGGEAAVASSTESQSSRKIDCTASNSGARKCVRLIFFFGFGCSLLLAGLSLSGLRWPRADREIQDT